MSLSHKVKAPEVFLKKGHKHRKIVNCNQNEDIIIEVENNMCLKDGRIRVFYVFESQRLNWGWNEARGIGFQGD